MPETTVVARLFTVEQAVEVCKQLDFAGINAKYEKPANAGNYLLDWNMPTPSIMVFVEEQDADSAEAVLQDIQDQEADLTPEELETEVDRSPGSRTTPPPLHETRAGQISRRVRSALNTSIVSVFFCPLAPYSIGLVVGLLAEEKSPQDSNRLMTAIFFTTVSSLLLSGALMLILGLVLS